MHWHWFCGIAVAVAALPAVSREPPAPYCMDARAIREVRQSDPRTLAVRLHDESRFRLELVDACPAATDAGQLHLVTKDGWVWGSNDEILRVGSRDCAVAGLARIDARQYAQLALASDRSDDVGTLDPVVVSGRRRRGFGGSTAYCVDARHLRSWHEDGRGLVVETSPGRAGGHRYYRVELGGSCPEAASAEELRLVSGVGLNLVCGHAGDRAVMGGDTSRNAFQRDVGSFGLARGCAVTHVYPIGSTAGEGAPGVE